MSSSNKPLFILFLGISLGACQQAIAQPFKPDASGYVSDPKFHKLIKTRGYSLVQTYDTVSRNPLVLHASVMIQGKWRQIDQYGKLVPEEKNIEIEEIRMGMEDMVPPAAEEAGEGGFNTRSTLGTDSFRQVYENGKYGTRRGISGKQGLPVIYDRLVFYEGTPLVEIAKDSLCGLALISGRVLIPPRYKYISFPRGAAYPLGVVVGHRIGKYCLVGPDGKELCEPRYDYIFECYSCQNKDYLQVRVNGNVGLIDVRGKEVIPPLYRDMKSMIGNRGYIIVSKGEPNKPLLYGVIDSVGNMLVEPVYNGMEYKNGLYIVSKGRQKGLMDLDAKLLTPVTYYYLDYIDLQLGIARVGDNSRFGMITIPDGKELVPVKYSYIDPLYGDSLLRVQDNGKTGYFDLQGKEIFPAEYQQLYNLKPLFFFQKDSMFGLMNRNREVVKTFDYILMKGSWGYFIVKKKGGKQGVIDLNWKEVFPMKYEEITDVGQLRKQGMVAIRQNGKNCYADLYGNIYCPGSEGVK